MTNTCVPRPFIPLLLLASLFVVAAMPSRAAACAAPSTNYYIPFEAMVPLVVPFEGVIALRAVDYSGGQVPTLTLRDAEGAVVPGEARSIAMQVGFDNSPHRTQVAEALLVFRADEPLTPGAAYELEVAYVDYGMDVIELIAANEAHVPGSDVPEVSVSAARGLVSTGPGVECREADNPELGTCPVCRPIDAEERVTVSTRVASAIADSYTLHRLVPEGDAIDREAGFWFGGAEWAPRDLPEGRLHFTPATSYCFHVESEDLVSGAILVGTRICLDDGEVMDPPADITPVGSGGAGCSTTGADAAELDGSSIWLAWLTVVAARVRRRRCR